MKTKTQSRTTLALFCSFALAAPAWGVQTIAINNPGFESPVLTDGSFQAAVPNWTAFNSGSLVVLNPSSANDLTAEAPQGANVVVVTSTAEETGLSQALASTLIADATYSLTAKVANTKFTNDFPGYRVQLVANGTILAEDDNVQSVAEDNVITSTVNYAYNAGAHAGLVGQALEIRLLSKGLVAAQEVAFDDVRLTVALGNPIANPGGPYLVASAGSLALNGSASLPSEGQTLTTYEWDIDNNGSYDVTGVNPTAISQSDLRTIYLMNYGANTVKLRVTDDSLPTPKTAIATATVTLSPPIACQLGVLNLSANGGINPNTGNPWQAGDKYRIAFHTNGTITTTSNNPEIYNDFATTEAWSVAALQGSYWRAMVTVNLDSTTTQALSPKREVKANTGTGDLTGGSGIGGAGEPVYVVNGTTCIARNNADIWDAWSNPFATSSPTTRVTGVFYSPFLNQNGAQTVTPDAVHGKDVATGCDRVGNHVNALGNTTDNTSVNRGNSNANTTDRVWNRATDVTSLARSLYVISVPLTIVNLAETVKPALISFVDDRAGADLFLGSGSISYTVTFSETIDASTLTTADFENAGSAAVTIASIRGTVNPAAFTVTVTPTTSGTVQLRTKVGAVIEDPVGNTLDSTLAIADDTTIAVVSDITPPTLVSIADNVSGGPILAFNGVTYTVTFSEPIDAATVNITDFANGGTAPITVNSAVPTGNPAVYTVVVTPTGAGTLTLGIVAGATISDLVGNPLVTTTVLPDDTTITINPDPLPTLVSIVDNQAGGPVFATQSFTYRVTFDQLINASTVDVTDFENGGSPAITVNAVARTSDPKVFAVHVTPGGAGTITLQIKSGAVITNVNGTALATGSALADDTVMSVNAGSGPVRGTITVNGSVALSAAAGTLSATLNAAGSSKLVVIVTGENNNVGNLSGDSTTVTYDGVPLTKVIDRNPIGGNPFDQTFNDIWYLDNPATSTGAIVASVNARGSVTAIALSGTAPGVGQTAISPQASKSVVLSTSFANSVVIASHGMGGDGNSANVTVVDADLPLIERSATAQASGSPSPWDGHVTATALVPLAGTTSYSFNGGNLVGSHTIAAEFLAAVAPANTYATWIGTYPAVGALNGVGDDADGDGTGNGVENFFGTNPSTFSGGLVVGVVSGGTFTFTHPQNATPASDLTAAYRWSKDLASFYASGASDGSSTVTFTTQLNTPVAGITTVTATVTGTATSKLFVGVKVTQN